MSSLRINDKIENATETLEVLHGISELLGCGLDKETLSIITTLIQLGVNPEALAQAVKELQRENQSQPVQQS